MDVNNTSECFKFKREFPITFFCVTWLLTIVVSTAPEPPGFLELANRSPDWFAGGMWCPVPFPPLPCSPLLLQWYNLSFPSLASSPVQSDLQNEILKTYWTNWCWHFSSDMLLSILLWLRKWKMALYASLHVYIFQSMEEKVVYVILFDRMIQ